MRAADPRRELVAGSTAASASASASALTSERRAEAGRQRRADRSAERAPGAKREREAASDSERDAASVAERERRAEHAADRRAEREAGSERASVLASSLKREVASVAASDSEREAEAEAVLRRALGLLARREHSRAELLAKLRRAGHGRDRAERAVEDLAGRGLVCDVRFAEAFIRSRVERGSGPLRIRRDLEARGVEPSIVDRLLDADDGEWEARARGAREKRFGAEPPGGRNETGRQVRFLLGRGFTRRQACRAIQENRWE